MLTDLKEYVDFVGSISGTYQNGNLQAFQQAFVQRYETEEVPLMLALTTSWAWGIPMAQGSHNDVNPVIDGIVPSYGAQGGQTGGYSATDVLLLKKYIEAMKRDAEEITIDEKDFPNRRPEAIVYPDTIPVMFNRCATMPTGRSDLPQIRRVERRREPAGALLPYRRLHRRAGARGGRLRTAGQRGENHCGDRPHHRSAHRQYFVASRVPRLRHRLPLEPRRDACRAHSGLRPDPVGAQGAFLPAVEAIRQRGHPPSDLCAQLFAQPHSDVSFSSRHAEPATNAGFGFAVGSLFSTLDYMPRIRYKNIVLSRRRWKLNYDDVKAFSAYRTEEHRKAFAGYMAERRLPRRVVHPMGDNELLLDLHDDRCVRLLFSLLRKYKTGIRSRNSSSYGTCRRT